METGQAELEGIYIGEAAGLEAWESWARGDVYTVILERLVTADDD